MGNILAELESLLFGIELNTESRTRDRLRHNLAAWQRLEHEGFGRLDVGMRDFPQSLPPVPGTYRYSQYREIERAIEGLLRDMRARGYNCQNLTSSYGYNGVCT